MKKFWKKENNNKDSNTETVVKSNSDNSTAQSEETTDAQCDAPAASTTHITGNGKVDWWKVFSEIMKHKMLYVKVLPVVFILSCLHIFNVPHYYTTSSAVAPEVDNPISGGGLSALASSFGFDLSEMQSTDAITPLLYPDLMDDNKFVVDLFKIQVTTSDGAVHCNYYDYLDKYKEDTWMESLQDWIQKNITGQPKPRGKQIKGATGDDPYVLPKKMDNIVNAIRNDIKIKADKKTGVITVTATAQDPLVCKTLADSATLRLQNFITTYRTSKAQKDVSYYKFLVDQSQKSYEAVRRKYAAVSDANQDVVLESVKSELDELENEMQLKYNLYTQYQAQYQGSIAKLREKTPAFTMLKGANAPMKPAGPKRMFFVAGMLIFAFVVVTMYVLRKIIVPKSNE